MGLEPKVLDFMHEIWWGSDDGTPVYANGHPWQIADEMARQGWDLTDPSWRTHPFFVHNRAVSNVDFVEKGVDEWMKSLDSIKYAFKNGSILPSMTPCTSEVW